MEPARQALPYGGRVERLPGEDQRLLVVAERRAVVLTAGLALRRPVVRVPGVAAAAMSLFDLDMLPPMLPPSGYLLAGTFTGRQMR